MADCHVRVSKAIGVLEDDCDVKFLDLQLKCSCFAHAQWKLCHITLICSRIDVIFGNVSAPCNTLVSWRHAGKFLRRSSQGNPSVGKLNQRVLEKNLASLDLCEAIYRKRCNIGGKLIFITNRKSHIGFLLVTNCMTLNDLERRNRPNGCLISPTAVALWAYCVKVAEDTRILSLTEM